MKRGNSIFVICNLRNTVGVPWISQVEFIFGSIVGGPLKLFRQKMVSKKYRCFGL